jgi:uncharacterized protein (DUF983 family)
LKIYNRYLLILVFISCLIDILLAFVNQTDIAVYFTVCVIAYLIITFLFIHFSPRTRRALSLVSFVFLAGFMALVVLKVVEVLKLK